MLKLNDAVAAYKEQYANVAKVNHITIDNVINDAVSKFKSMCKSAGLSGVRVEDVRNLAAYDVIKLYVERHKN